MAIAGLAQGLRVGAAVPGLAMLSAIGAAGCAAAGVSMTFALTSDHLSSPGLHAGLLNWLALMYVLAGLVAWRRRPESRFGTLMVAAGFAVFLSTLSSANAAVPYTIGVVFDLLPAVLFLHVFLAFPSGRLERRAERALIATAYVTAVAAQLAGLALGGFGPDNLLGLVAEPEAAFTLLRIELVVLSTLALAGIGVLVVRRRSRGPFLRRSVALLVDAFALGLVMIAVLLLSGAAGLVDGKPVFETIRRTTFVIIGLAPLAFLVGLLEARLARSAVGDLVVALRANPSPADLRTALARALRDPSLDLLYWLSEYDGWADSAGRPARLPEESPQRATTVIERDGTPLAALIHDPSLAEEAALLQAVAAAASIALENGRLQVDLRARLDELTASRRRIVEAAQSERRRLERNLHDGAQQRLVSLSLEVGLLELRMRGDPEARRQIDQVKRELAGSLEELRELARGLHPAVLSGHGLAAALEGLAARAPVRVDLRVQRDIGLPEQQEIAAYYLVAESLANVAKHAAASCVSVEVARDADRLVVEVTDDGRGGAAADGGSGLRGLADRVEALEGRLSVRSPIGEGTSLRAEIPCA